MAVRYLFSTGLGNTGVCVGARGRPRFARYLAGCAMLAAGCAADSGSDVGSSPPDSVIEYVEMTYSDGLRSFLGIGPGDTRWRWLFTNQSTEETICGHASLRFETGPGARVSWSFHGCAGGDWLVPASPRCGQLTLVPELPDLWHTLATGWPPALPDSLLPLARVPVESAHYADLLDLLQRIAGPRFGQVVTHWPDWPLLVQADSARSGQTDLVVCLDEAVNRWNAGEQTPCFVRVMDAEWGIQLVHLPGVNTSPPMWSRLTRFTSDGRPLRMNLVVSDGYGRASDGPRATRDLTHELGHALLLWGHSEDRGHLLWRCGPLVDHPSRDERQAARLWRLLPEGLDISRYGRLTELESPRQQRERPAVEQYRAAEQLLR